jgi:hypothetical protein
VRQEASDTAVVIFARVQVIPDAGPVPGAAVEVVLVSGERLAGDATC